MSDVETWFPVTPGEAPDGPPDDAQAPGREPDGPVTWNWWGQAPETRRGRMPFQPTRVSHVVTAVVAVAILGLVFFGTILAPLLVFLGLMEGREAAITAAGLQSGLLENAVTMLGLPLLWVAVFYRDGIKAAQWRLHMRSPRPWHDVGLGLAAGVVILIATVLVAVTVDHFFDTPPNEVVQDLAGVITWPLVILLAVVSGTTEEVFFRGFLQNRIGIVPANVIFGFAHMAYGTPMQVIIPLALGFAFSALVVRTRSLVPAIVAHMFFNGVQLGLAKWAVESGLA